VVKIGNLELYVGTKEEYNEAVESGMKIVCALNRVGGFVCHQSVVGWSGRGCDKDHPHYLYKRTPDAIYLNMIDGEDPAYISDKMIDEALDFIDHHIENGEKVFVYCSLGESRSPSIALMYLLEQSYIESRADAMDTFKIAYYEKYQPKRGNSEYIRARYLNK